MSRWMSLLLRASTNVKDLFADLVRTCLEEGAFLLLLFLLVQGLLLLRLRLLVEGGGKEASGKSLMLASK